MSGSVYRKEGKQEEVLTLILYSQPYMMVAYIISGTKRVWSTVNKRHWCVQ